MKESRVNINGQEEQEKGAEERAVGKEERKSKKT
jgi:hypothetical protein